MTELRDALFDQGAADALLFMRSGDGNRVEKPRRPSFPHIAVTAI